MTAAAPPRPATEFDALIRLVGEPFLFARRSYGDELVLHFGEQHVGPPRVIKGREFRYEYGSYSLHLQGSAWALRPGTGTTVFSEGVMPAGTRDWLEQTVGPQLGLAAVVADPPVAPGARVTAVIPFPVNRPDVTGYGLRVELSDGATLVVVPTPDDDPHAAAPDGKPFEPLPDWVLRTPHGELAVGPGRATRVTPPAA